MKAIFEHSDALKRLPLERCEQWMSRVAARLEAHKVEVPANWRRSRIADLYFPGECFSRAIQFIQLSPHLPQAMYVLGEATCGGLQQHGWVEIDDVVFDGVLQEFYSKAGYYKSECARAWYRFDRQATMLIDRTLRRQETWLYRWDLELRLPWAKSATDPTAEVLLIDKSAAKGYLTARKKA
jgi:hypothetical protein